MPPKASVPRQPYRVAGLSSAPCVGLNGCVVAVAGKQPKESSVTGGGSCHVLFLQPQLEKTGWVELEHAGVPPCARRGHAVALLPDSTLVVCGGERPSGSKLADLFCIALGAAQPGNGKLAPRTWQRITVDGLPEVAHHAIVARANELILHGGIAGDGVPNTNVYVVNVQAGTCKRLCNTGVALSGHQMTLQGSTLTLFGGQDRSGNTNRNLYLVDVDADVDAAEETAREDAAKPSYWTESDIDDDDNDEDEEADDQPHGGSDDRRRRRSSQGTRSENRSPEEPQPALHRQQSHAHPRKAIASPNAAGPKRRATTFVPSKPRRLVALAPCVQVVTPANADAVSSSWAPFVSRADGSILWCGPCVHSVNPTAGDAAEWLAGACVQASADDDGAASTTASSSPSATPDDGADDNQPAASSAQSHTPTTPEPADESPVASEHPESDNGESLPPVEGSASDEEDSVPEPVDPTPEPEPEDDDEEPLREVEAAPGDASAKSSRAPSRSPAGTPQPQASKSGSRRPSNADDADDVATDDHEGAPDAEKDTYSDECGAEEAELASGAEACEQDDKEEDESPPVARELAANPNGPHAVVGNTLFFVSPNHVFALDVESGAWNANPVASVASAAHILPRNDVASSSKEHGETVASPTTRGRSVSPTQSRLLSGTQCSQRIPASPQEPTPAPYKPFPPILKPSEPVWTRSASTNHTVLPPLPPVGSARQPATSARSAAPATQRKRPGGSDASTPRFLTSPNPDHPVPKPPPHTARPAGKQFTARGQKKHSKEVQRQVQSMALKNLAATRHVDATVMNKLLKEPAKDDPEASPTTLDLSTVASPVDLQLLFLVESALSTRPKLSTLHVAGCTINQLSCCALVSLIQRVSQILAVTGIETAKLCGDDTAQAMHMEEAILNACEANRATKKAEKEQRKARRQEASKKRKEKNAAEKHAAELPLLKKRAWYGHELTVSYLIEAQKLMRGHTAVIERGYYERITIKEREAAKALQEFLLRMEEYRKRFAKLGLREQHAREDIACEQLKEHATLMKGERDGKRKANAVVMAREKRLKVERDTFERTEKQARGEVRSEEDEQRRPLFQSLNQEYAAQKAIDDQIRAEIEAERAKADAERRKEERAKEAARLQREQAIQKAEEDLKACVRREELNRDREIVQSYRVWTSQVSLDMSRELRRVEALDAKRQREAERTQYGTKAPQLTIENWHASVPFCRGSTGSVPVVDAEARLAIDPVLPAFMMEPPKSASMSGSERRRSSAGRNSAAQKRDASGAARGGGKERLEDDEVPNQEWIRQKSQPLGCTITVKLNAGHFAEGDEVLLDAPLWKVDPATGIISSFPDHGIIGGLTPAHAVVRPPEVPPPPPETPDPMELEPTMVDGPPMPFAASDLNGTMTSATSGGGPPPPDDGPPPPDFGEDAAAEGEDGEAGSRNEMSPTEEAATANASYQSSQHSPTPAPPPPPPPVDELSIFIPFNSCIAAELPTLLATIGSVVGFFRGGAAANPEASPEATGTITIEVNTLVPKSEVGYGADPCRDLLHKEKATAAAEAKAAAMETASAGTGASRPNTRGDDAATVNDESAAYTGDESPADSPFKSDSQQGEPASTEKPDAPETAAVAEEEDAAPRVFATAASVTERMMPDAFGYAYNTTTVSTDFSIDVRAPILALAEECKYLTFNEGQNELQVFPSIPQADGPSIPSVSIDFPFSEWTGAVLSLDMGPMVQKDDHLWILPKSNVSVADGVVRVDDVVIGIAQEHGIFGDQALSTAVAGMPTRMELVLEEACTAKHVLTFLRSLVFRNLSRNPTDTNRFVRASVRVPSQRLMSDVCVGIRFETVDDLTVVDLAGGGGHVTFFADVRVPDVVKDYVKPEHFCFAAYSDVYDVDTTDFKGGQLLVRIVAPHHSDTLTFGRFNPLVDVDFEVTADGKVVVDSVVNAVIKQVQPSEIKFHLHRTSIEHVAGFIRSIAFRTEQSTALLGSLPVRRIETFLTVESSPPVKSTVDVRIASPLLIVPSAHAAVTYQENGGAVRLCPIDASLDDEGWDGGWIKVEFLSGYTADDVIDIREDDELHFTNATGDDVEPLRTVTVSKMPPGTRRRIRDVLLKRRREMIGRRSKLRARYDQSRRDQLDLDDAKTKVVWFHGARVGVVIKKNSTIYMLFDEKMNLDGETRFQQCSIHRNAVAAVLKRLTFENLSDDPQELQKVVTITANNGLPHSTTAVVQITVQTQDDVTEIHRVSTAPREFRCRSEADRKGFCVFDDCTVYDPDTFAFNAATLQVKLVGGGDPKGDQLGVLSQEEQKQRFPDRPVIAVSESGKVTADGVDIGTVELDAPNPEGHSNVRFIFAPLPEELSRPNTQESNRSDGALVPTESVVKSHNEAQTMADKGVISIGIVERCLQVITYTCRTPPVAKASKGALHRSTIYQASVGFPGCEGRLKVTVAVHPPMLSEPDQFVEVPYKENEPAKPIVPKITVGVPEKTVVKEGTITIAVDSTDENDVLGIEPKKLNDGVSVSKDRDKIFVNGKEPGGKLKFGAGLITLSFDYSSKITVKQLVIVLRSFTFMNKSDAPVPGPREVHTEYRNAQGELLGELKSSITVQAEDDPTEIKFQATSVAVPRLAPPLCVCADAAVTDPDTEEFGDDTKLKIFLSGPPLSAADTLVLLGRMGPIEGEITKSSLNPALATLIPAPPPEPRKNSNLPAGAGRSRRGSVAVLDLAARERERSISPDEPIDNGPSPVLAKITRKDSYTLTVQVVKCTIDELQHIVRSVALRFDMNPKDREGKKTLNFELACGKALSKAKVAVEVQPPLIEPPPKPVQAFALYGGSPGEVIAHHVAPSVHYADGGMIEFAMTPPVRGCILAIVTKYGTSTKGDVKPVELFGDGKRVGTLTENADKSVFTMNIAKGFGSYVNKLIKSVGVQAHSQLQAVGVKTVSVTITATTPKTPCKATVKVDVALGDSSEAPKPLAKVPSSANLNQSASSKPGATKPRRAAAGKKK